MRAEYGQFGESTKPCWHYTIKWHGFTIAQTAEEDPIPAAWFDGDGEIIWEYWRELNIPTSSKSVVKTIAGYDIHEPKKRDGVIEASPYSLGESVDCVLLSPEGSC